MRTIWKGAISFGLVHIPIKMYPATKRSDISFNLLHTTCRTPVKYKRYCPHCDTEVANEDIVKGYEYEKGKYVLVTEQDFESIPLETTRAIHILDFVDLSGVDPIYFDKTYYLAPNDGGQKAYELLRQAMDRTGMVAIAKVIIRSKETLAAIRVLNNVIVMETMFYHEEIRSTGGLQELNYSVSLHENELKMAESLINNLSGEFQAEKYRNEYLEALMGLIQKKIAGEEIAVPEVSQQTNVVDLMDALRESIKQAKEDKTTGDVSSKEIQPNAGGKRKAF